MIIPKKILDEFEAYCKKNSITGKAKEEKFAALKERLKKYIYEPGEAIGVVAAQSISEPATQMSCAPFEKVILKKDSKIGIVEIGKFTDKIVENAGNSI
ncbi:MAG: intein-containing DNA-directed RNA polymerase subunit A'', partial [Candidatus Aenigmarchaeota archaeon]|nr:intein-containing DNA-directed RNA polymerase subunit A'' [Candidatus Aenigmarchaeota archaeon]